MSPASTFFSSEVPGLAEVETFSRPGTGDVTAGDRKKLAGLLKHYRAEAKPFTACKRDQMKHGLSEEHANRRCAVIKDLIEGTTKWRKGRQLGEGEQIAVEVLGEALRVVELAVYVLGSRPLAALLQEAKLSAKSRKELPASAFAIPDKRAYPIHDESHARNALSRAAGKPEESRVRAAVKKRYPKMVEELIAEAADIEPWMEEVRTAAALIEAAPKWMIPVAARRPGFRPSNPEKRSKSSGGTGFNENQHRRAPKGTGIGGQFISTGASGREVTAVQRRLGISETGTYGGLTKRRVERFQRNHGLQVDGIVGAQTVAAMRGNTSVEPGALTRHDRRYLRRYVGRTSASGNSRVVRRQRVVTR